MDALEWRTPAPLGFIWFRVVAGNQIELLDIHVNSTCRRRGVGSALLNELRGMYPSQAIITQSVNDLSRPFLLHHGFHREPDCWVWRPDRLVLQAGAGI